MCLEFIFNFVQINTDLCECGCDLTINKTIIGIFLLFIIVFLFLCYHYKQKRVHKKRNENKICPEIINKCENIVLKSIQCEQNEFCDIIYTFLVLKIDSLTIEKNKTLICFCDGSYSHQMQMGHAGFLTSDGFVRTRFVRPLNCRNGSTDTEVLAAYYAIKYAFEQQCNTLIIYTDNSKVEQILNYRKTTDRIQYRDICQILDRFLEENEDNSIVVRQTRGHTTRHEQKQCQIKANFAKIDRILRKKTRRFRNKWWINFMKYYVYINSCYMSNSY